MRLQDQERRERAGGRARVFARAEVRVTPRGNAVGAHFSVRFFPEGKCFLLATSSQHNTQTESPYEESPRGGALFEIRDPIRALDIFPPVRLAAKRKYSVYRSFTGAFTGAARASRVFAHGHTRILSTP